MAKRNVLPSMRGRGASVPTRRTSQQIVREESTWHPVSSSWVRRIRFIRRTDAGSQSGKGRAETRQFGDLDVEFKSGAQCRYAQQRSMFLNMLRAGSKGKFVHRHLYHEPYTLLAAGKKGKGRKGKRKSWR